MSRILTKNKYIMFKISYPNMSNLLHQSLCELRPQASTLSYGHRAAPLAYMYIFL